MAKDKKKRPYRTPSVRTEKVYERKSLACGKAVPPMSAGCLGDPKVS